MQSVSPFATASTEQPSRPVLAQAKWRSLWNPTASEAPNDQHLSSHDSLMTQEQGNVDTDVNPQSHSNGQSSRDTIDSNSSEGILTRKRKSPELTDQKAQDIKETAESTNEDVEKRAIEEAQKEDPRAGSFPGNILTKNDESVKKDIEERLDEAAHRDAQQGGPDPEAANKKAKEQAVAGGFFLHEKPTTVNQAQSFASFGTQFDPRRSENMRDKLGLGSPFKPKQKTTINIPLFQLENLDQAASMGWSHDKIATERTRRAAEEAEESRLREETMKLEAEIQELGKEGEQQRSYVRVRISLLPLERLDDAAAAGYYSQQEIVDEKSRRFLEEKSQVRQQAFKRLQERRAHLDFQRRIKAAIPIFILDLDEEGSNDNGTKLTVLKTLYTAEEIEEERQKRADHDAEVAYKKRCYEQYVEANPEASRSGDIDERTTQWDIWGKPVEWTADPTVLERRLTERRDRANARRRQAGVKLLPTATPPRLPLGVLGT